VNRGIQWIRLLTVTAGLVLLVPLPGCAQDRSAAGERSDALEAFQTGEYGDAVRAYRTAVRAGRDLPESARGWARALAATGKYEAALEALDEAEAAGVSTSAVADLKGEMLRDPKRSRSSIRSSTITTTHPASAPNNCRPSVPRSAISAPGIPTCSMTRCERSRRRLRQIPVTHCRRCSSPSCSWRSSIAGMPDPCSTKLSRGIPDMFRHCSRRHDGPGSTGPPTRSLLLGKHSR